MDVEPTARASSHMVKPSFVSLVSLTSLEVCNPTISLIGSKKLHPVVLSGDFNGVPSGYLYLRLLQSLRTPHLEGNRKMGSFEPLKRRWLPFKIDWTLHSPEISNKPVH